MTFIAASIRKLFKVFTMSTQFRQTIIFRRSSLEIGTSGDHAKTEETPGKSGGLVSMNAILKFAFKSHVQEVTVSFNWTTMQQIK